MDESENKESISNHNPISDEETSASESESLSPSSSISSIHASSSLDEREELFIDLLRYSTAFEMSSRKKNTPNSRQDTTKLEKKKIDKEQEIEKEAFFARTFFNEFVNKKVDKKANEHDDLLFFVRKQTASNTTPKSSPKIGRKSEVTKQEDRFFVVRREAKNLPIQTDNLIDWEETFFLNLLMHHFTYSVEVSIRVRDENPEGESKSTKKKLKVQKNVVKKVYATPNNTRMDKKSDEKSAWNRFLDEIKSNDVKQGQLVCVELFAEGDFFSLGTPLRCRLFAGGLDYEVIRSEYKRNKWVLSSSNSTQFFNLMGPQGKGNAQMAVCVKAEEEVQSSPNYWAKFGGMLKKMTTINTVPQNPTLNCQLASLSMRWDILMKDIFIMVHRHISGSTTQPSAS